MERCSPADLADLADFMQMIFYGVSQRRIAVTTSGKKGMLPLDQIRTIDRQRIVKVFRSLFGAEIRKCKEVLREIFMD